jgi:NAD(P)H-dependent FMN reductase
MYSAFKGKPVGLLTTSPGALGGLRGLQHVDDLMVNLGCSVAGKSAVGNGFQAFDEETGDLTQKHQQEQVHAVLSNTVQMGSWKANSGLVCEVAQLQRTPGAYGQAPV